MINKKNRSIKKTGFSGAQKVLIFFLSLTGLLLIFSRSSVLSKNSPHPGPQVQAANIYVPKTNPASPVPTQTASPIPTPTLTPKPLVAITIPASGRGVRVPILYYHYIGNNPNPKDKLRDSLSISPNRFEEEMRYLAQNGYNTITYEQLYNSLKGKDSLPSKPIMLTFDDGYIDFYINAFPILRQFNFKAVSFIPTGKIDSSYYLHWNQIKEMADSGLIDFEAHTVNHPNLVSLSPQQLKYQLIASKQKLEQELGKKINFMAYPYGTSNSKVWQAVKEAGFLSAAGTWASSIQSEGQIYNLPRIRMGGAVTIQQFAKKIL